MDESGAKTRRGGARAGAGRKRIDAETRTATLIDELIFPAVCAAFHAAPGQWNERILTFELSGVQIRDAYGHEGLREWKSYFTSIRKGGCTRDHIGYKTLWRFNNAKYSFVLKLVESLGHTIKDLPKTGFPPQKMLDRLRDRDMRRVSRLAKNAALAAGLIIHNSSPRNAA